MTMFIKIKNLKLPIEIGVFDSEKNRTQPVIFNFKIEFEEGDSPKTDNIKDTLDYSIIAKAITDGVINTKFELLESLMVHVESILAKFEKIKVAEIEIDKPHAPIPHIDSVSISRIYKRK